MRPLYLTPLNSFFLYFRIYYCKFLWPLVSLVSFLVAKQLKKLVALVRKQPKEPKWNKSQILIFTWLFWCVSKCRLGQNHYCPTPNPGQTWELTLLSCGNNNNNNKINNKNKTRTLTQILPVGAVLGLWKLVSFDGILGIFL